MYIPKISIVTITYNSEKTLEETIQSVVSQKYPNLEYLIIDGGSKDKTLDIVEKYRDKISLVISEPDRGISDAFNKGIKYATGEIVGIINSDDLLLPGVLKTIAENYDPMVGVYRGNTIIWNDETNVRLIAKPTMKFPLYSFKRPKVCHPSTFISKSSYDEYGGYNIDYKYRMDLDLLMRLYNKGVKFKYVDSNWVLFRLGGTTASSYRKKIKEVYQIFRSNGANTMLACIHVVVFIVYEILKRLLSVALSAENLRKLKYK